MLGTESPFTGLLSVDHLECSAGRRRLPVDMDSEAEFSVKKTPSHRTTGEGLMTVPFGSVTGHSGVCLYLWKWAFYCACAKLVDNLIREEGNVQVCS